MSTNYELGVIPIMQIDIGNRYRKDYGDLDGLRESFKLVDGIISTISVKRNAPGGAFPYTLCSGGRRYFAALAEKIAELPARIYPEDTSEETLRIIEKVENVVRKDFAWMELIEIDAEIHRIQKAKYGDAWTQQQTANIVGKTPSAVTETLQLFAAITENPEAFKDALTMSDARNIMKRLALDKKRTKLANAVVSKQQESPVKTNLADHFVINDVFLGMAGLRAEQFDGIEIDPPYGINFTDLNPSPASTLSYTEVDAKDYDNFLAPLLKEAYRVAKPDSWLLLWQPLERLNKAWELILAAGFRGRPLPLVWNKMSGGVCSNPGVYPARTYETCLFARKGNKKLNRLGRPDVMSVPTVPPSRKIHPAERPKALMGQLFDMFFMPGAFLLSPFAGSGVPIVAAHELHMFCMGFDLDQQNKDNFIVKYTAGWDEYTNADKSDAGTGGKEETVSD